MTQTLSWARRRISRRVEQPGHYYEGTATSGTTTTLADANLPFGNEPNHWATAEILATSGANSGLARKVTASSTGSLTFVAFSSAIGADTYEVRYAHPTTDIDQAITEAIIDGTSRAWLPITGTATWVDGTETYTLPATLIMLTAVEYTDDSGINHPIRFNHYRCPGDGSVVLDATALGYFTATTPTITFRGLRYPAIPSAASDPIEVPETFVVYSAIAALRGEGYSSPATDPDNDAGAFTTFMQYAQSRGRRTPVPPNAKRAR